MSFTTFTAHRSPGTTTKLRRGRAAVINQWERGLLFRNGAHVATLEGGRVRRWRGGYALARVDMRPWLLSVPTQEVPTADGVTVKVTVAARVVVTDPLAFVVATQNAHEHLYLAVQVALRDVVALLTVDELVATRAAVTTRVLESVRGVDALGVVLDQLELKDIVLPLDLKRAQAEVLLARAEGLAALERARGETAALRNLANAASMAADNPMLIQLRLLQQLGSTSGHTVVIGAAPLGQTSN